MKNATRAESVCPLDCPDRCTLEVTLEDERVVSIDGTHLNPFTEGFICSKVREFPERLYSKDRVLYPSRRIGPRRRAATRRCSSSAS